MSVPVIEEELASELESVLASANLTPDNALVRVDNPTGATPRNIQKTGITVSDIDTLLMPGAALINLRDSAIWLQSNVDGEAWLRADVTTNIGDSGAQAECEEDFALTVVGKGHRIKEGTNATMGITAAMVAGTVTVSTTKVTTSSRIFLTAQSTGAAPGALRVSAISAGVSFTITSTSATDTSTVAWLLIEPS